MKMGDSNTGGGDFENAEPGTHLAVCYGLLDIGTQQQKQQDGTFKNYRKIIIKWELPKSLMEDGRPHITSNRYTLSTYSQGHLRPAIDSWLSKKLTDAEAEEFEMKSLLGKACLLSLVQNGEWLNVAAIMAAPEEHSGETVNDKQYLFLNKEEFDQEVFDKQSEKTKATIMSSPEYMELFAGVSSAASTVTKSEESNLGTTLPDEQGMPPTTDIAAYEEIREDEIPF